MPVAVYLSNNRKQKIYLTENLFAFRYVKHDCKLLIFLSIIAHSVPYSCVFNADDRELAELDTRALDGAASSDWLSTTADVVCPTHVDIPLLFVVCCCCHDDSSQFSVFFVRFVLLFCFSTATKSTN